MPVRRIPKNYLVTTGRVARPDGEPAEYEGTIENDYYILLKYDPDVMSFDPQPVKIQLPTGRKYTPDVLVHFRQRAGARPRPPELTEIKPEKLLRINAAEYAPKFAAARAYCIPRGWVFVVKSKKDMNEVRLQNIRELRGFLRHPHNEAHHALICEVLQAAKRRPSVNRLLSACADKVAPDLLLSSVWRGVIGGLYHMDMDEPIAMTSLISLLD